MGEKTLFCEVCGRMTAHAVEIDDEAGEMALCRQCGRLSSVPAEHGGCDCAGKNRPPAPIPPRPR